jgi:hypothetical protein
VDRTPHSQPGPSQRHLRRRSATIAVLLRHCTNLVAAAVSVAHPPAVASTSGRWLLGALGCWAVYRLATRSPRLVFVLADLLWTLAVCVDIPGIVTEPHFYLSNSAPQAIAGIAIGTFALQVPARLSLPMAALVAASYCWGAAGLIGWRHVVGVDDIYFFLVQWATGLLIRVMMWRISGAVDTARSDRQAAELARQVADARRNNDREQLALLHDTAAATLLLVGQGTPVAPSRLAAQATRDLRALSRPPWLASTAPVNVVAALREDAAHLTTPVRYCGEDAVWLDGPLAAAVVATAREVTNNVDRHAQASVITIQVDPKRVTITDDGIGFAQGASSDGHGIRGSIIERMHRAGGAATITSVPAHGTVAELSWAAAPPGPPLTDPVTDSERVIDRLRGAFSLAAMGFALANLASVVPWGLAYADHTTSQVALAIAAAAAALTALPGVLYGRWRAVWVGAAALAVIAVLQPLLLSPVEVRHDANWSQGAVGWCLLPLLLRWPTRRAVGVLATFWLVPAAINLIHQPTTSMAVFVGHGIATFLIPQVFALLLNSFALDAARAARAESEARMKVVTDETIAAALEADTVRRFSAITDRIRPLLSALSQGDPVTPAIRRQAMAESRTLRALFDEVRHTDNALGRAVELLAARVEARGVEVSLDLDADCPNLSAADVNEFLEPIACLLDLASRHARIVVTVTAGELMGSAVCDVPSADLIEGLAAGTNRAEVVWNAGSGWVTTSLRLPDYTGGGPALPPLGASGDRDMSPPASVGHGLSAPLPAV